MDVTDERPLPARPTAPSVASRAWQGLLSIVFPPVCAGCRVSGTWMCRHCVELMPLLDPATVCPTCGAPDMDTTGGTCDHCRDWRGEVRALRSYAVHDSVMREAVHRLKYEGESARAQWAGPLLAGVVRSAGWQVDVIVPVPLHARRLRKRGYNQADVLARETARVLGVPASSRLMRVRDTRSQVGLDPGERRENVRQAFQASPLLAAARVLLIDDVVTTGATLHACAEAMREVGATDVVAVTLARAVDHALR